MSTEVRLTYNTTYKSKQSYCGRMHSFCMKLTTNISLMIFFFFRIGFRILSIIYIVRFSFVFHNCETIGSIYPLDFNYVVNFVQNASKTMHKCLYLLNELTLNRLETPWVLSEDESRGQKDRTNIYGFRSWHGTLKQIKNNLNVGRYIKFITVD